MLSETLASGLEQYRIGHKVRALRLEKNAIGETPITRFPDGTANPALVITSYSIHYTKLYENGMPDVLVHTGGDQAAGPGQHRQGDGHKPRHPEAEVLRRKPGDDQRQQIQKRHSHVKQETHAGG